MLSKVNNKQLDSNIQALIDSLETNIIIKKLNKHIKTGNISIIIDIKNNELMNIRFSSIISELN